MTQQDQEQEGSAMVDQQDQETKGPTMERRKTMTMNWEGLGEEDDDAFFETHDRLSTAVPIDLLSSEDDDEDYDDSRASFASAVSAMDDFQRNSFKEAVRQAPVATMFGNYDMWMAEPGSIKDRRKKLLQGMGLASNKNLLSTKFMHVVSKKVAAADQPPKTVATATAAAAAAPASTAPESATPPDESKQEVSTTTTPPRRVMLVRSRSDGDIETFSAQTRSRKEELLGKVSKQRLTRTSSVLLTSQAGICLYANNVKVEQKSARTRSSIPNSDALLDTQFGAFFLIKNLDTGKEFIVKEFNNEGMWNKLSEVQTGKQLTMEEFEKSVGYSPVVKELMRRAHADEARKGNANSYLSKSFRYSKKRGVSLLKNLKGVATSMSSGMTAEKELQLQQSSSPDKKNSKNSSSSSSSSSSSPSSKWVKVRTHGKSIKDFSALHLCQEIQAHEGSIWTMKFSPDARYLATAGEDRVIHVWEVQECDVMQVPDLCSAGSTPVHPMVGASNSMDHRPNLGDASPMPSEKRKDRPPLPELSPMISDKKRKGKSSNKKKGIPDYVHVPETVFSLSEKPICTFTGHQDDVLDLSWSKSQLLLSASMDKTVRLWDMETKSCLKLFAHNDYVTCIQFNPIDDDYFISGSLDEKVRIWSIPDRQLIDYTDLHEMVTSACYTPDGQGAIVGSHKGSCRLYSTAECRIEHKEQFELRRKKKSMLRKVTGFQYSPSNPSEMLVTSADSRIRILDGSEIIHKFKGFKNTSSQICASFSADGKHVISASEDSQVYIWKREPASGKGKGLITTQNHEHFQCKDVSVAIPWPGQVRGEPPQVEIHSKRHSKRSVPLPPSSSGSPTPDESGSKRLLPPLPKKNSMLERSTSSHEDDPSVISRTDSDSAIGAGESFSSSSSSIRFGESPSISASASSPSQREGGSSHGGAHTVQATAWGLVIVTAGMEGEIRAYQNFGLPSKVGRL